ncbi:arabinofuranosyltransferase [Actinomadura scrupuli]|uniref:arabinofuranosyltransferase n=1 Tax=Actinomadura scrupuli TaxID=559629 RepID=UPI003D97E73A
MVVGPIAAWVPARLDLNPFLQAGADKPLVIGGLMLAVVGVLCRWQRGPVVAGLAAGLYASFLVLVLRSAWEGTPFPAEGVFGDTGRLAAMATRYTITSASSDGIVAGVPSEYPPLYPWLIGKAAVHLHTEAWRLLAPAAIIAVSGAVVAGFALWTRLTSAGPALAITVLVSIIFSDPTKPYEILALAVVVPWLLLTFGDRNRLPWPVAGVIGGLMFLVYFGYLVYAGLGIVALAWSAWRASTARLRYVLYLLAIMLIMLVMASWFLFPYGSAMLDGGQQLGDKYESSLISANPFPFLEFSLLGLVQLAGVVGLLCLRRSVWWGTPLLALVVGTYGYYLISLLRYTTSGHSGLLYYTRPLISSCLLAAAVLTVAHIGQELLGRLDLSAPSGSGAIALSIVLVFAGYHYWHANMPVNRWSALREGGGQPMLDTGSALSNRKAAHAHNQSLPDGERPRYAIAAAKAGDWSYFPAEPIRMAVEGVLGPGARPRTLSYDDQLFAFYPWPGYIGVDRNASGAPARWDDRFAELRKLAGTTDPAAFAQASKHTPFGAIDVFILHRSRGDLVWQPLRRPQEVRFTREQFDPANFVTIEPLQSNTVVVIRLPGR